jgi:nitroreductase
MSSALPAPPELGDPLPPSASREALRLLAARRSSSAQALSAPGPSPLELEDILRLGARVPDHGKLAPWRFIVIDAAEKPALIGRLTPLAKHQAKPEKALAVLAKLAAPPVSILVVSSPKAAEIPLWEQELSAGAVCMNLLLAAAAFGYGANWITDWYSLDDAALKIFGIGAGEKVAGFIHMGTPPDPPLERVRPELQPLLTHWTAS